VKLSFNHGSQDTQPSFAHGSIWDHSDSDLPAQLIIRSVN
jgi:hypothetical protein